MSELTPCNRCTLTRIEYWAKVRGATVDVRREKLTEALNMGSDRAWYVVRVSDREGPVAWFMELTEGCAC